MLALRRPVVPLCRGLVQSRARLQPRAAVMWRRTAVRGCAGGSGNEPDKGRVEPTREDLTRYRDQNDTWVDRYVPEAARPYLKLARVDRPIGAIFDPRLCACPAATPDHPTRFSAQGRGFFSGPACGAAGWPWKRGRCPTCCWQPSLVRCRPPAAARASPCTSHGLHSFRVSISGAAQRRAPLLCAGPAAPSTTCGTAISMAASPAPASARWPAAAFLCHRPPRSSAPSSRRGSAFSSASTRTRAGHDAVLARRCPSAPLHRPSPHALCPMLRSIVLGASSLALVAAYPAMKRVTYWPQAFLGATLNWGALVGYAAVTGSLSLPVVLPLYAGSMCWTIVYDTIYAHQDADDDRALGLKSSALLLGDSTKPVLTGFAAAALAGWGTAGAFQQQQYTHAHTHTLYLSIYPSIHISPCHTLPVTCSHRPGRRLRVALLCGAGGGGRAPGVAGGHSGLVGPLEPDPAVYLQRQARRPHVCRRGRRHARRVGQPARPGTPGRVSRTHTAIQVSRAGLGHVLTRE